MHDLIAFRVQLRTHCLAAQRHSVLFTSFRGIPTQRPVKFARVDLDMRAALILSTFELRPYRSSEVAEIHSVSSSVACVGVAAYGIKLGDKLRREHLLILLTVFSAAQVVVLSCNTNMTVVKSNKPTAVGTVRPVQYRFRFNVESDHVEVFDDLESATGPRRHIGKLAVAPGVVTISWEAGVISRFDIDRKSLVLSGTSASTTLGAAFSYAGVCGMEDYDASSNKF